MSGGGRRIFAGLERHLCRLQGDPRLALHAVREAVLAYNRGEGAP